MHYEQYYKLMGLSSNANIEDIKKAYQKLAMKYHPDRRPNDPHAADKFTRMKKAFDILLSLIHI